MTSMYFDGQWIDESTAGVPVDDLAVQRGFGVFESLRAQGSRIFYGDRHFARMRQSAELLGLELPWNDQDLNTICQEGIRRNNLPEASIKVIVTGGSSPFLRQASPPRLLVLIHEFHGYPTELYAHGASLRTSRLARILPEAKHLNYIPSVLAWRAAERHGDHEALFVGNDDTVLECATANFFLVHKNTIITATSGVLPGTTRQLVLELATTTNLSVEERTVHLEELPQATEAFITSANRKIMPVVRIDDQPIGTGAIGSITRQLMTAFANHEHAYFEEKLGDDQ